MQSRTPSNNAKLFAIRSLRIVTFDDIISEEEMAELLASTKVFNQSRDQGEANAFGMQEARHHQMVPAPSLPVTSVKFAVANTNHHLLHKLCKLLWERA